MKSLEIIPLTASAVGTSISIPGSKSYTNRALLLAALVKSPVTVLNTLKSDDTEAMIECLEALGVKIHKNTLDILVEGTFETKNKEVHLNARLSGTTIRFILALICTLPGIKILQGEAGLNKRPIMDLVNALRNLGAEIEYIEKEGFPPIKVSSSSFSKNTTHLRGDLSSQFVSALLMIGPTLNQNGLEIIIDGEQISKSYIDITLDIMKYFGVTVENKNYQSYVVPKRPYSASEYSEYTVEGDYSSAAYFAAIAALTHSTITLENLNPNSVQGDKEFFTILENMGNEIKWNENGVTVKGHGIKPVTIDMSNCPDQAQTLAVLAAFAQGKTYVTGIKSLRVKETERIKALQTELAKIGIKTESTEDSLTIFGGNPHGATIDTYGDHRMAMAFAVAGTRQASIIINNPEVVEKTFPDFWEKLEAIGIILNKNL